MSETKQKFYPSEFKESSVKLAIESKHPIAKTVRELGIKAGTLYTWVDKYPKPRDPVMRSDEHLYDEETIKERTYQSAVEANL